VIVEFYNNASRTIVAVTHSAFSDLVVKEAYSALVALDEPCVILIGEVGRVAAAEVFKLVVFPSKNPSRI
jgi:predicted RNase H-like nuclease